MKNIPSIPQDTLLIMIAALESRIYNDMESAQNAKKEEPNFQTKIMLGGKIKAGKDAMNHILNFKQKIANWQFKS